MKTMNLISDFEEMLEKKLKSVSGGDRVADYRLASSWSPSAEPKWGKDLQPVFDWCEIHNIRPFWNLYKCVQFFDKENELIVRLSVPTPNGFADLHFIVPLEFAEKVLVLGEFPEAIPETSVKE